MDYVDSITHAALGIEDQPHPYLTVQTPWVA
jgi:hypothetical protein